MNAPRHDHFSLSQFTTGDRSFHDDVALCRDLGIGALEVCEAKLPRDRAAAAELLHELRDAGLAVSSVQARVHSLFPDQMAPEPLEPAARAGELLHTMDRFAEAFPGERIDHVLISGRAPDHDFARARATLVEIADQLADEAAARGARIVFEPLHPVMMNEDAFVCGWDGAVALAEAIDHEAFGLVCDTWNVWDQPDIITRVRESLPRVPLFHVGDWRDGGPRRLNDRLVPGRGVIPFADWGRMLGETGYDGWVALEMLSDVRLPDSYLREPLARVVQEGRQHLHHTGMLREAVAAPRAHNS